MKKLLKKKDGFTLVELIVVIAILAILAAVAIPAYSGYINKAKDAAILDDLGAVSTAATAANANAVTQDGYTALSKIEVSSAGAFTFTGTVATKDFNLFYTGTASDTLATLSKAAELAESNTYKNGAEWTPDGGWKAK